MSEKAPQKQMNNRFELDTRGIISLAIILMFTVALIAGQARANLPAAASADSDFANVALMNIGFDESTRQTIEALPHLVDIVLALPIDIELRIDGVTLGTGGNEDAGSDDASVQ